MISGCKTQAAGNGLFLIQVLSPDTHIDRTLARTGLERTFLEHPLPKSFSGRLEISDVLLVHTVHGQM